MADDDELSAVGSEEGNGSHIFSSQKWSYFMLTFEKRARGGAGLGDAVSFRVVPRRRNRLPFVKDRAVAVHQGKRGDKVEETVAANLEVL